MNETIETIGTVQDRRAAIKRAHRVYVHANISADESRYFLVTKIAALRALSGMDLHDAAIAELRGNDLYIN